MSNKQLNILRTDKYKRGSEWRKWDLHTHTPDDNEWVNNSNLTTDGNKEKFAKEYIKFAKEQELGLVAVTDHNLCGNLSNVKNSMLSYIIKEAKGNDITILPGFEITVQDAGGIHILVIFPEDTDLDSIAKVVIKALPLTPSKTVKPSTETIDDIKKSILELALECLFVFAHADSSAGILHKDTSAIQGQIRMSVWQNPNVKLTHLTKSLNDAKLTNFARDVIANKETDYIRKMPYIVASDCRKIIKDGKTDTKYLGEKFSWIKADTTFNGLLQAIYFPEERIFSDTTANKKPGHLAILEQHKINYIKNIEIKKKSDAKAPAVWFDVNLPINNSLSVIIGNKGSGKSALTDIIGHTCKCKVINTDKKGTFLNNKAFRKRHSKHNSFADDYETKITFWDDSELSSTSLSEPDVPEIDPIRVKYLPQQYIEDTCSSIDNGIFSKEINNLMLEYLKGIRDIKEANFDDFMRSQIDPVNTNINSLKTDLNIINEEIIKLETKRNPEYLAGLKTSLSEKEAKLKNLTKNPIAKVDPPQGEEGKSTKLSEAETKFNEIETLFIFKKYEFNKIGNKIKTLEKIDARQGILKKQISLFNEEVKSLCLSNEIDFNLFTISPKYLDDSIGKLKISLNQERAKILIEVNGEANNDKNFPQISDELEEQISIKSNQYEDSNSEQKITIETLNKKYITGQISLKEQLINIFNEKQKIIIASSEETRKYAHYQNALKLWEKQKNDLIGNFDKPDTIKFIEKEIEYITKNLDTEYLSKKTSRIEKISEIFKQKQEINKIYENIYSSIKAPIEKALSASNKDKNPENNPIIKFETNIYAKDEIIYEHIFNAINKQGGTFKDSNTATERITQYIKELNTPDIDIAGTKVFVNKFYDDTSIKLSKNFEKINFYNNIGNLDYINIDYKLTMDNRSLDELSPGQRGLLLLTFYLSLSKDRIPLIIDQPEDNLDNQSVYKNLVNRILYAKNNRQIIVVTHNPNIAIACDAEQIIYAQIDKEKESISYISGSIENPTMRKHVLDVLEGTAPAFDIRSKRYENELVEWHKNNR